MSNINKTPQEITNEIFDLYAQHGDEDYIGEPVSQIQHMAQAAALAMNEGYDDEVILGAFLHDIGHLCVHTALNGSMDGYGNINHEKLGADFLQERGFSKRVLTLVNGHVEAKRYLTFKNPDYFKRLSEASKQTLTHQGGVMTAGEAHNFEQNREANLLIKMRLWDDEAKLTDIPVTIIPHLETIMVQHLRLQKLFPR